MWSTRLINVENLTFTVEKSRKRIYGDSTYVRHTALKWVLWLQTRAARCPDTVPAVTVNRGMVPVFARLFRGHVAALQSKRVSPSAWPESIFIRARKFTRRTERVRSLRGRYRKNSRTSSKRQSAIDIPSWISRRDLIIKTAVTYSNRDWRLWISCVNKILSNVN